LRELAPSTTLTDATAPGVGTTTVNGALPVTPELVAVICAEPALIAVTEPSTVTLAIAALLDDHSRRGLTIASPFTSRTTADAEIVCPTTGLVELSDTLTLPI
jgi:hypothetical protein